MPEISLFYGIRITMYYEDHNPPHFHAEYNGNKAVIDIDKARVIKGSITIQTTETDSCMVCNSSGRIDAELGAF